MVDRLNDFAVVAVHTEMKPRKATPAVGALIDDMPKAFPHAGFSFSAACTCPVKEAERIRPKLLKDGHIDTTRNCV